MSENRVRSGRDMAKDKLYQDIEKKDSASDSVSRTECSEGEHEPRYLTDNDHKCYPARPYPPSKGSSATLRPRAYVPPRSRILSGGGKNRVKRKPSKDGNAPQAKNPRCTMARTSNGHDEAEVREPVKLDDKQLLTLTGAIGKCWEMLGVHLDIAQTEIEKIKLDHQGDTFQQIFRMLYSWKCKHQAATVQDLIARIRECKFVSVNYDVIEKL